MKSSWFLGIVYSVNVISNLSEQKRIEPYGQHVSVDGENMNVLIQGNVEETVVLLPGFGTATPVLDFKLLIEELSPFYKVVVVEPFGYRLSDLTEKERSTENILSEIHEALQNLHIDRYILMGHSISGIYGSFFVLISSALTEKEKIRDNNITVNRLRVFLFLIYPPY